MAASASGQGLRGHQARVAPWARLDAEEEARQRHRGWPWRGRGRSSARRGSSGARAGRSLWRWRSAAGSSASGSARRGRSSRTERCPRQARRRARLGVAADGSGAASWMELGGEGALAAASLLDMATVARARPTRRSRGLRTTASWGQGSARRGGSRASGWRAEVLGDEAGRSGSPRWSRGGWQRHGEWARVAAALVL